MRYRRDKLRAYAGLQITEAKLVKDFGAKYLQPDNLEPDDVVIFWGDWSKADGWRHQAARGRAAGFPLDFLTAVPGVPWVASPPKSP